MKHLRGPFATTVGLGLAQFVNGLLFFLGARDAGATAFGSFISLYYLASTIGAATNFGAGGVVTLDLIKGVSPELIVSRIWGRVCWSVVPALILTIVVLTYGWGTLPVPVIVLLTIQSFTIPFSMDVLGVVRALRSSTLAVWLVALGNAAGLVLYLVVRPGDILFRAALGTSASWVITIAAALMVLSSRLPPIQRWKGNPWRDTMSFGVTGISYSLQQLEVTEVAWASGPLEAGLAGGVARWTLPLQLLTNGYSSHMFPKFAASTTDAEAYDELRRGWVVPAFTILACLVMIAFAQQLVLFGLGPSYLGSVSVLRLLAGATALVAIAQPAMIFLQARGQESVVAKLSVLMRVCAIIWLWPLARAYGASAIGLSLLASSTILACTFAWLVYRTVRKQPYGSDARLV